MKKGRHRRFEEARNMKRSIASMRRRCPECGAEGDDDHAAWCMAEQEEWEEIISGSLGKEDHAGGAQNTTHNYSSNKPDLHSDLETEKEE